MRNLTAQGGRLRAYLIRDTERYLEHNSTALSSQTSVDYLRESSKIGSRNMFEADEDAHYEAATIMFQLTTDGVRGLREKIFVTCEIPRQDTLNVFHSGALNVFHCRIFTHIRGEFQERHLEIKRAPATII